MTADTSDDVTKARDLALRRGDELWERLRSRLDAHLQQPLTAGDDWTGHDVYSHFARWQEASLATAREILAERYDPVAVEDEDLLSERWREEDRALVTQIVRERCLRTRAELRALLAGLTARQWRRWGSRVAADIAGEHYEHHLAAIAGPRA